MEWNRVSNDSAEHQAVYDILRLCGEDMYERLGLVHWRTPYPLERIRSDCAVYEVYLAYEEGEPVATFRLADRGDMLELSKFGVRPGRAGRGIGGHCLAYMEMICRARGYAGLCLDVYDQSTETIRFYQNRGFRVTGTRLTQYFQVLLMEKKL